MDFGVSGVALTPGSEFGNFVILRWASVATWEVRLSVEQPENLTQSLMQDS